MAASNLAFKLSGIKSYLPLFLLAFLLTFLSLEVQAFQGKPRANFSQIDWSQVPAISNKRALTSYIHACVEARQRVIPVLYTQGFFVNALDLLKNYLRLPWSRDTTLLRNQRETRVVYEVIYYPGMRVSDAYLSGNRSNLTKEEQRLYQAALPIVHEAMKLQNPLARELYIHNTIAQRTRFYQNNQGGTMPRHTTALGVLLDGQANCQGYSDAFYMLGRMCDLKVDMMAGQARGSGHTWNTIELNGKTYIVDVTWNDDSLNLNNHSYVTYYYFNAPREIAQATHRWDPGYEYGLLAERIDEMYFYGSPLYYQTKGQFFGSAWPQALEGLNGLARHIAQSGWVMSYALLPFDREWSDSKTANDYLLKILKSEYGWIGRITLNVATNKGWPYMFYTIIAKRFSH
ncbi:MAG: hypothetical protein IJU40_05060 [Desulfovibrionaceae bacterium]|nr:hypothetical protein [Desulfovibrionaceae bacterium]